MPWGVIDVTERRRPDSNRLQASTRQEWSNKTSTTGTAVGRNTNYLSVAQFDLLRWVADGCKGGVYEGSSHRVSARGLHNRGFVRVSGSGSTWSAQITPEGARRIQEEAKRVEAERERVRQEEQKRAERERAQQELRDRAEVLLHDVVAAGGRLDLGPDADPEDVRRIQSALAQSGRLPEGQRLAQEPTRMDPVLGVTVYLEPDFAALTPIRSFAIPRQLRNPHPAVADFQNKRALVSKAELGRAARFLQALISAATDVGWKTPSKGRSISPRRGEYGPDFTIRLPSRDLNVTIRELDQKGRRATAYNTETDYYTRTERTTANKYFQASGNLEVTLTKTWEDQAVLSVRDTKDATIEEQLPTLIRNLEIAEAEADWSRQEESRRSDIRKIRWEEVKQEAFTKLSYERNADALADQLQSRQAVADMRAYAGEVEARAEVCGDQDAEAARGWANWIREHADRVDPINGPLHVIRVTTASRDDLGRHMNGWSAYGPHRN